MNVIIVDNPLQKYVLDDILLVERTEHQVLSIAGTTPVIVSESEEDEFWKLIEKHRNHQGKTIILLGDVYYTDAIIKEIMTCDTSLPLFFGKTCGNGQTNSTYDKELLAISFTHEHWTKNSNQQYFWSYAPMRIESLVQKYCLPHSRDLTSRFFNQKQFDYWLVTYQEYQRTGRFRFKHHPIKFDRTDFKYLDIMSSDGIITVWLEVYLRYDSQLKGSGISLYINGYEVYRGDLSPNRGHCHWNISQTGNLVSAKLFWPKSDDIKDYIKNVRFDLENNIGFAKSFTKYKDVKSVKFTKDILSNMGKWAEKTLLQYIELLV